MLFSHGIRGGDRTFLLMGDEDAPGGKSLRRTGPTQLAAVTIAFLLLAMVQAAEPVVRYSGSSFDDRLYTGETSVLEVKVTSTFDTDEAPSVNVVLDGRESAGKLKLYRIESRSFTKRTILCSDTAYNRHENQNAALKKGTNSFLYAIQPCENVLPGTYALEFKVDGTDIVEEITTKVQSPVRITVSAGSVRAGAAKTLIVTISNHGNELLENVAVEFASPLPGKITITPSRIRLDEKLPLKASTQFEVTVNATLDTPAIDYPLDVYASYRTFETVTTVREPIPDKSITVVQSEILTPTPLPTSTSTTQPEPLPSIPTTTVLTPSTTPSIPPRLLDSGSPCTGDAQCESSNCRNKVCCLAGKVCCTADKHCDLGETCDTDRFYCAPQEPLETGPLQLLQEDPFKFFMEYWELVAAILGSLSIIAYYLHLLKRKTIGEEKVKVRRGVTREGNVVKIGVKVINDSTFPLVDVGVELDVPKAFRIDGGSKFIDLGTIRQDEYQSAIFNLVPTRCVSGNVLGSVIYHDVKNNRKIIEMEPVTVGSVCPFLEKVPMDIDKFKRKVKSLPSQEKRMKVHVEPEAVFDKLENKCSAMHMVSDAYSPDGNRYMAIFTARGAYSKNFIAISFDLDMASNELVIKVYGEQEEMITGLLSEIVEIVEEAAGMNL